MKYQTPDDPAANPNVLLDLLRAQERAESKFVYRGQLREWPGPLIASLYRRSIRRQGVFTDRDPRYQTSSLRKCGRRFIEMAPDSSLAKLITDAGPVAISRAEYDGLMRLSFDPDFTQDICKQGHEAALLKRVHPTQHGLAKRHLPLSRQLLDETHRAQIRQLAFLQPFGYMLGMTLAQQYGFSSELLDFTASPDVAFFFATHADPTYVFLPASEVRARVGSEIGVIYRLPSTEGNVRCKRVDAFNYYTCPPQLHLSDLCRRFEDKSSPEMMDQLTERLDPEHMTAMSSGAILVPHFLELSVATGKGAPANPLESVDRYLHLYYVGGGIRYFRLLDVPVGTFERSRLGRQRAVAILPDELRDEEPGPDGKNAAFQAVEDVAMRAGCERFYFRHSDRPPDLGPITREYLWPEHGDFFKLMISRVLDPASERYHFNDHWIPKRLDLVSNGFTRQAVA